MSFWQKLLLACHNTMNQDHEFTLAASPLTRTRNAGKKRDYKCLADGPINEEVLRDVATQARLRRACAALPRDPNEPPRKRGRPRKERPLAADEQQTSSCSTPSWMSANTDIDVQELHLWQKRDRSTSASTEEKEEAFRTSHSPTPTSSLRASSEYAQDVHGGTISYSDLMDTADSVNLHSSARDVAALLLAVAEQARLEKAEQAQSPQSSNNSSKGTSSSKTKGRKGRSRRRRC